MAADPLVNQQITAVKALIDQTPRQSGMPVESRTRKAPSIEVAQNTGHLDTVTLSTQALQLQAQVVSPAGRVEGTDNPAQDRSGAGNAAATERKSVAQALAAYRLASRL